MNMNWLAQSGLKFAATCFLFVALFATGCSGISAAEVTENDIGPETVTAVEGDDCNCGEVEQLSKYVASGQTKQVKQSIANEIDTEDDESSIRRITHHDQLSYSPHAPPLNVLSSPDDVYLRWPVGLARGQL